MRFYTSCSDNWKLIDLHIHCVKFCLRCCDVFADIKVMQINKCRKGDLDSWHYTLWSGLISGHRNYAKNELGKKPQPRLEMCPSSQSATPNQGLSPTQLTCKVMSSMSRAVGSSGDEMDLRWSWSFPSCIQWSPSKLGQVFTSLRSTSRALPCLSLIGSK